MNGAYVLILHARRGFKVKIGSLGVIRFNRGYYTYVGSAKGKTISVERRVERHRRLGQLKTGRVRWHIDYLLRKREVTLSRAVTIQSSLERLECHVSRRLKVAADGVVSGFGSSDCKERCQGHLYYFRQMPLIKVFKAVSALNLFCPESSLRRERVA